MIKFLVSILLLLSLSTNAFAFHYTHSGIASVTTSSTTNSGVVSLKDFSVLDVTAAVTVSTPAAKSFTAASDVNTATDVVTLGAHGYLTGLKGQLTTTTTLPAGLSLATDYYIIVVSSTTVKFATSQANAIAGTAVDITTTGTGTHTFTADSATTGAVKLQKNYAAPSETDAWFDIASSSQSYTGAVVLNWTYSGFGARQIRMVVTGTSGANSVVGYVQAKE